MSMNPTPPGLEPLDPLETDHMPRFFWVLIGAITLLAVSIVVLGAIQGYRTGLSQAEAQKRQRIAMHLQRAEDYLAQGNGRAAVEEYRQALLIEPGNEKAIAGLDQALIMAANPPTPTPTPSPLPPTPANPIDELWSDAQSFFQTGRWEEAIQRLQEIQAINPSYRTEQVREMLFTAYANLGMDRHNAGRLEEAVRYFDKALALRPEATDLRNTRDLAAAYLDALTYWYADWPKTIDLLEELYQRDPEYRDVRRRLQEAHAEYGASLERQGQWCAAADQYAAARAILDTTELAARHAELLTLCQTEGSAQVGQPITGTATVQELPIIDIGNELGTGRILYDIRDPVDGRYRIVAQPVTASVRPVVLVEDGMNPDLRPDGQRLAFRSMRGDQRGLAGFDPASGLRLRLTEFAEDVLPSWNPLGNRLVFASNREGDRRWRIYVAWADGKDSGTSLGFGSDPDWSPVADRIVYRGCDERGNRCGLWLMDSNGTNQVPLTQVSGDARPTWSPNGQFIYFMSSERDGNWEIYRVDVTSKQVIRLTNNPGIDGLPTVSPDGTRIAFVSNRDGGWAIWIMPSAGGTAQRLAPINGELPNWLEHRLTWIP